ncbi:MAG: hypothetical protein IPI81_04975 [Flavobacteriales bacterium]|nr:hypothetical protein [Flavobacteriales bacterium]MCC6939831.1 hypothetical protein [Flavobacteriales bacterium]
MRLVQRYLTDLLNLFLYDPEEPNQLWPWWRVGLVVGLVVAVFWVFGSLA